MGAASIVRVEVERPSGPLRKWEDALSAHVGQVDPGLRKQEAVRCLPMDERPFTGRMEYGALGEMLLCKVAATNYRFTRSLITPTPTLPIPMMLVSVSRGSGKFVQCGHTCILTDSDWTLIDTKQPLEYTITSPEIEAIRDHAAPSVRCSDCRPLRAWRRTSIERQVGIVAGPARHGERELRRDAPSSRIRRKKTGRGHYHDGMGRLARTDRDAAGVRTPRRTTDAGQGLYRGESRRFRALRRANGARMQHFRPWAAPPFRRGSGRIRIALSLAASAHPLRGGASRPEPGASLDNRRLLLIRLQQFVAFLSAVQWSVRSFAGSLSPPILAPDTARLCYARRSGFTWRAASRSFSPPADTTATVDRGPTAKRLVILLRCKMSFMAHLYGPAARCKPKMMSAGAFLFDAGGLAAEPGERSRRAIAWLDRLSWSHVGRSVERRRVLFARRHDHSIR